MFFTLETFPVSLSFGQIQLQVTAAMRRAVCNAVVTYNGVRVELWRLQDV